MSKYFDIENNFTIKVEKEKGGYTMKLVNCEIKVPKKYQETIKEIEYVAEHKAYNIQLHDGFAFDIGEKADSDSATLSSKKAVLDLIKTVVEIEIPVVLPTVENNTERAVKALNEGYKRQIKSDFSVELISLFPTEAFKNYNPLLPFDLLYGENGKKSKTFQSNGSKFYIKSKGQFVELNESDEISVFAQGENFENVNAIEILKAVYSYHKKRSYASSLRKSRISIEELLKQEESRQNEKVFNDTDDKLKSKIVHDYLVIGSSIEELSSKYDNAETILHVLNLNESYCGNFKGVRNGAILSSLRGAKRFDLVKLFELYFYGLNNNIQRLKQSS